MKGGHFFPEVNPEDTEVVVKRSFSDACLLLPAFRSYAVQQHYRDSKTGFLISPVVTVDRDRLDALNVRLKQSAAMKLS